MHPGPRAPPLRRPGATPSSPFASNPAFQLEAWHSSPQATNLFGFVLVKLLLGEYAVFEQLLQFAGLALVHYEIGIRIGELSLPPGFDGVLMWGHIYNRPFLRCLHGYGLCLWRLGKLAEAQQVFERILSLNPNDNQGVRFCREEVRAGRSWEELRAREQAARAKSREAAHARWRESLR